MYMNFHISYPLVLSYFDENRIFSTDFGKKRQNFMKIRPVGAALYRADGRTDGQTDMTKQILALRSFANVPNNRQGTTIIPVQHTGV
jgi:CRISPR/Cas system endoribonuclease Cas6 (RAMP superfamily)